MELNVSIYLLYDVGDGIVFYNHIGSHLNSLLAGGELFLP